MPGADPESACDSRDVDQADVALPTLHAADIGAVKLSSICQGLLGQARCLAKHPDPETEPAQDRTIIHKTGTMPGVTTMGLQTMSSIRYGDGRSFLKWAGGKTRYADQLASIAPKFEGCYFEPFMGSAALFFEMAPAEASLSDAN